MKFKSKDDIPAEWGNPDTSKPRWVVTRYVPWTSWKAGAKQWGLSSVRQGENSGTITHEIAHFAFRIGRQQQQPVRRAVPPRRAPARGTSWTAARSTDPADRTAAGWCRPPKARSCRRASCSAAGCRSSSSRPDQVLQLSRNGLAQHGPGGRRPSSPAPSNRAPGTWLASPSPRRRRAAGQDAALRHQRRIPLCAGDRSSTSTRSRWSSASATTRSRPTTACSSRRTRSSRTTPAATAASPG